MIEAIQITIYFLSILLPGYLIFLMIIGQKNRKPGLADIFYSFGLGNLLISLEFFIWIFLFRQRISLPIFHLFLAIQDLAMILYIRKQKIFPKLPDLKQRVALPKNISPFVLIMILLTLLNIVPLLTMALNKPVASYDSLVMWSLKTKALYYTGGISFDPENTFYLGGGSHINYPWLIPLTQYWLHLNLGEYNDLHTKLIFVFYFLGLLSVFNSAVKDRLDPVKRSVFIFLLSSIPLIHYHGYNAYADLPLAFYVLVAFFFLFRYFENPNRKLLLLSGLFWAISFFTKDTAIFFILGAILIMTIRAIANKERQAFKLIFYIVAPLLPWILFKLIYRLDVSNVGWQLGFHPEIWKHVLRSMFWLNNWNIWIFALFVFALANLKSIISNRTKLYGWLWMAACFTGLITVYLFTERYLYAVDYTAFSRNLIPLIPVSFFLTALLFERRTK
ncbi:hypothetical protein GF382_02040 [Candidatus Falkowbacteria bacterium]|nr:hypothetical protein [Candidatus Falkowbacteria bacterium]